MSVVGSFRRYGLGALAVCVAYYVGANLGFILRFPPATPSVMWPPNAILTAALLLVLPRWWWLYLLAAFPAHAAAELGMDWPAPLVLALFATNCSEALIAAVFIRRFSDEPARFDTLRRVVIFIVGAVLLAPFLSSFLDAAAVAAFLGESYWVVWRTRFPSNVLTELTLVPAIVMLVTAWPAWIRRAPRRRRVEAAILAVALLAVEIVVVAGTEDVGAIPGAPGTPLAFLSPLVLWAAVRFGPAGASLSLVTATLFAIWAAVHARGPFIALTLGESVAALQIFLTIVAIPLMCLAALIEERRRAQEALTERLRFEEELSGLSGAFVHVSSHEMDRAIEIWLGRLGDFLGLDRLILLRLADDQQTLAIAHSWAAPTLEPLPPASHDFSSVTARIRTKQPFVFPIPGVHPDEATRPDDPFGRHGIKSMLIEPLVAGGRVLGGLAFVAMVAERTWPEDLVQRLRLFAPIFANALSREASENAMRANESMKSAILASLSSSVAVLDREGRIIAVNEGWARYALQQSATPEAVVDLGANYLDTWRQAAREDTQHASEALMGIQAVLDRSRSGFTLEYPSHAGTGECWVAMSVVPLTRPEGGAVISYTEVTERKRAEAEAQRSRQELAHFTRVSTIGELTASLAHELNQPLTGILTNAQAARRFLDATPPDLGEIRSILRDIVEDDKRAGEVIQRLRDLLRKGESEFRPLDLNALIRDVARLLGSDTIIRNVALTLDFAPDLPIVTGDRVQLQQVVLNLLLNAMEAMAESGEGARTVVVRTQSTEMDTVQVAVQDTGTGLPAGTEDMVFEPFYTTKPAGMGMGLAIVRSIIDSHGGLIWALNNPTRGATFHFALPLARERSV